MLEEMSEPGTALLFVAGTYVVPEVDGDRRAQCGQGWR